jgi:glutathione S-transferase
MKLTLYFAPMTCALVPFITLNEAGADFELNAINTRKGGNRTPEFLKLNPKHKVPVLIIDGEPLTENVAIQVWIHRQFPKANLLPADPKQEIKAISLMAFCASGIHPKLTPNARPENYCDLPGSEESVKRVANKLLFEDLKIVDDLLAGREWFFPHFTACDAYFFWCFKRAISFKLDVAGFRNCMAHYERMQQRPSVQKALAREKQLQEEFARAA